MGTEGEYFRAKTHITILKTVKINHIYVCASIINKIGSYEQTAQITPLPPLIPKNLIITVSPHLMHCELFGLGQIEFGSLYSNNGQPISVLVNVMYWFDSFEFGVNNF